MINVGEVKKSKMFINHLVVCVTLMIIIILSYQFALSNVTKHVNKNHAVSRVAVYDPMVLASVEKVVDEKKEWSFNGWVINPGMEISSVYMVLQPINGKTAIATDCDLSVRDDVAEHFGLVAIEDSAGFCANMKKRNLEVDECYEIFIDISWKCDEAEYFTKTSTGQYWYNGMIYRYNPMEFQAPDIDDNEIDMVITDGILKGYDKEQQIWIYQYQNSLYYIMNVKNGTLSEQRLNIPVLIYTSKKDMLPDKRKQYGFDNLGAYVENNEYQRPGILPYQITKVNIDVKYPVMYIETGVFATDDKNWIKQFWLPFGMEE